MTHVRHTYAAEFSRIAPRGSRSKQRSNSGLLFNLLYDKPGRCECSRRRRSLPPQPCLRYTVSPPKAEDGRSLLMGWAGGKGMQLKKTLFKARNPLPLLSAKNRSAVALSACKLSMRALYIFLGVRTDKHILYRGRHPPSHPPTGSHYLST